MENIHAHSICCLQQPHINKNTIFFNHVQKTRSKKNFFLETRSFPLIKSNVKISIYWPTFCLVSDAEWEPSEYPESEETALIETLSKRLEAELRTAKRTHLSVGEVLLPNGLTRAIAQDMFQLAETEPCGLKGCTLYIVFETNELKTKLSTVKCDPITPTTFELYLTFRQSAAGWNSFLPQFLKWVPENFSNCHFVNWMIHFLSGRLYSDKKLLFEPSRPWFV